jgi:hypothetical protein
MVVAVEAFLLLELLEQLAVAVVAQVVITIFFLPQLLWLLCT